MRAAKGLRAGVFGAAGRLLAAALALAAVTGTAAAAPGDAARVFKTPEDAVRALSEAARASDLDAMLVLFGPDGRELASSSDAATARRNRDVFVVAMDEGWRLVDRGAGQKELVVGHEGWPFPVPLVKTPSGWAFDAAGGKAEVLVRRIGRNELAVIRISGLYVTAQRLYASRPHDGRPAGLYASRFTAAPGTENGLYWPVKPGTPRSPFGPLVAEAAAEGRAVGDGQHPPVPFHGYYFRILDGQGPSAPGGSRSYVVDGGMSGGFALIAWPAEYDATGIMTFMVGPDGVVYEKDLGAGTATVATGIKAFDPDATWQKVDVVAAP